MQDWSGVLQQGVVEEWSVAARGSGGAEWSVAEEVLSFPTISTRLPHSTLLIPYLTKNQSYFLRVTPPSNLNPPINRLRYQAAQGILDT